MIARTPCYVRRPNEEENRDKNSLASFALLMRPELSRARSPRSAKNSSLPFHTLGGNRVRFERGRINLRADNEWRSKMTFSQKLIVGALTFPLLVAYGYIGVPEITVLCMIPRLPSE